MCYHVLELDNRPLDLPALWTWACDVADAMVGVRDAPLVLHSQSGERKDWGKTPRDATRGLPFTSAFAGHLDGYLPPTAPVRALRAMRYGRGDGELPRAMFRICLAVLRGERDREILRQRLRMAPFAFHVAALQGLATLKIKTEYEAKAHEMAS